MKRTTMYFEESDLAQLCEELALTSEAEAVRKAIKMALQTLAYRRIKTYAGSEKGPATHVPRRREPAVRKARGRVKKSA